MSMNDALIQLYSQIVLQYLNWHEHPATTLTIRPQTQRSKNPGLPCQIQNLEMPILVATALMPIWLNGTHHPIQCAFVHDQYQMRYKQSIHQRYKTKPCLNFYQHHYCKYGDRCLFLHNIASHPKSHLKTANPIQYSHQSHLPNKYQQHLKILVQHGIDIINILLHRNSSKICHIPCNDQCHLTSISTQNSIFDFNDQMIALDDDTDSRQRTISQYKKTRMYSI